MAILKRQLALIREWSWVIVGLIRYAFTGKTLPRSWNAVVSLFCRTEGRSTEVIHKVIASFRRPYVLDAAVTGILGTLSEESVAQMVGQIHREGYVIPPFKIPDSVCDALTQHALETHCNWVDDDMNADVRYPRGNPSAVRYQLSETNVINHPAMQRLMADPTFLAVSQAYLGCRPILDLIGMWWTTDFNREPQQGNAATMYHFDMTHIRWVNFFFYLSDVTPENGPHTFVRGSHRPGEIPRQFLKKGYTRLTDYEVESHYGSERVLDFVGPRGTIIIEDTRGLHKARPVLSGDRLMAQISFADCAFGGQAAKSILREPQDSLFAQNMKARPGLYEHFLATTHGTVR